MIVGVFMGTFDPLHGGHIGQILRAHKAIALTKVLILVDENPSHKPNASSLDHRVEMTKLTLDSLDLPIEYSVESAENGNLAALTGKFTHRIVGIDSVISDIQKQRWGFLVTWPMLILSIPGIPRTDLEKAIATVPEDIQASLIYTFVDEMTTPLMNYDFDNKTSTSERVHSTQLRAGGNLNLIPTATKQYIQRHQLYN